jgi:hypothetical protein
VAGAQAGIAARGSPGRRKNRQAWQRIFKFLGVVDEVAAPMAIIQLDGTH